MEDDVRSEMLPHWTRSLHALPTHLPDNWAVLQLQLIAQQSEWQTLRTEWRRKPQARARTPDGGRRRATGMHARAPVITRTRLRVLARSRTHARALSSRREECARNRVLAVTGVIACRKTRFKAVATHACTLTQAHVRAHAHAHARDLTRARTHHRARAS
eukprot:5965372-Pleurochrysis_carterae.AAC.2